MKQKRILLTWFGDNDLLATARELNDPALKAYAHAITAKELESVTGKGDIQALLEHNCFDEVHILFAWDKKMAQTLRRFYQSLATIHCSALRDPFSFEEAFNFVNHILETTVGKEDSLSLYLTPGTPAMVTSLLLLGRTRFPATFFRRDSKTGLTRKDSIPLDIVMGGLAERTHIDDASLQHYWLRPDQISGPFQTIAGTSPQMKQTMALADRAADKDVDILLLGESGTGKDLFAQAIHRSSRRKDGPYIARNCAAIPEALLETELFGSLKGGHSEAKTDRDGAFKQADGGTLFLDEVGEMSPNNQAKLLRVLQPWLGDGPCIRRIQPVGMKRPSDEIKVNVRIIAATNRNLQERISQGAFRDDLLYRLAAVKIQLPPLREHPTDIPIIAKHLLERINDHFYETSRFHSYERKTLSEDAIFALCKRSWPGNVRELEAVLKQVSVFLGVPQITAAALDWLAPAPANPSGQPNLLQRRVGEVINLHERLKEIEKLFIQEAYKETRKQKKAAALLGIAQQTVSNALKPAGSQAKARRKK